MCHRCSETWDLFPTEALDFPGKRLWCGHGHEPSPRVASAGEESILPRGAALDNSEGNGEQGNVSDAVTWADPDHWKPSKDVGDPQGVEAGKSLEL